VDYFDEFLRRHHLRRLTCRPRIKHVFTNMVLDDLSYESIQSPATGSGLLQDIRTLIIRIDRPLNRFNLAAQSFHAIQELYLFFRDVTHGLKPLA
jgi:hypothetical protein